MACRMPLKAYQCSHRPLVCTMVVVAVVEEKSLNDHLELSDGARQGSGQGSLVNLIRSSAHRTTCMGLHNQSAVFRRLHAWSVEDLLLHIQNLFRYHCRVRNVNGGSKRYPPTMASDNTLQVLQLASMYGSVGMLTYPEGMLRQPTRLTLSRGGGSSERQVFLEPTSSSAYYFV